MTRTTNYYGNGRGLVHLTFFPSYLNYLSVFSGAYEENKQRIGFDGWFSHTKNKASSPYIHRKASECKTLPIFRNLQSLMQIMFFAIAMSVTMT